MSQQLVQAWQDFIDNWFVIAKEKGLPRIEHDSDWPSPCEFEQEGQLHWQPVKVEQTLTFDNVEQALDIVLNDEFKQFFSLFYSDNLDATHDNGQLQFLQAWSQSDFERLQQNLIGHLMMKSKLKQGATLFVAVTDEDDLNIVINNETGEVCLEYVGKEPHQVLAKSLAEFITQTQPVILQ